MLFYVEDTRFVGQEVADKLSPGILQGDGCVVAARAETRHFAIDDVGERQNGLFVSLHVWWFLMVFY